MAKLLSFALLLCSLHLCFGQPSRNVIINPTGTYVLKGEKYRHEIRGHYGEIRVKLITDSLVAVAMYSNSGYPGYASASFTDTILYTDNKAIYYSKADPSCRMIFEFDVDGVNIKQIYTDPASTCGFGKGVIPLGFTPKYSSYTPVIHSLSRLR